jgi:transcriptional regulator with XRE-family HTH domain
MSMAKIGIKSRGILKKFGLQLRKFREQRDWTLENAEDHGFSSWRYLQRLEAGKHNISLLTLIEIGKLYKVHPSELLKEL